MRKNHILQQTTDRQANVCNLFNIVPAEGIKKTYEGQVTTLKLKELRLTQKSNKNKTTKIVAFQVIDFRRDSPLYTPTEPKNNEKVAQ